MGLTPRQSTEQRIRRTRATMFTESLVEAVGWLDCAIGVADIEADRDRLVGLRSQLVVMLRTKGRAGAARDHAWSLRLTQLADDLSEPLPVTVKRTARKRQG